MPYICRDKTEHAEKGGLHIATCRLRLKKGGLHIATWPAKSEKGGSMYIAKWISVWKTWSKYCNMAVEV